jgi:hypothetical protein
LPFLFPLSYRSITRSLVFPELLQLALVPQKFLELLLRQQVLLRLQLLELLLQRGQLEQVQQVHRLLLLS